MGKRIVIALGGNALGNNLPEQMKAVKITAKAITDLIEDGNEVVICHGNGPQVGMIQNAMAELTRSDPEKYIPCPLSVCVAPLSLVLPTMRHPSFSAPDERISVTV